MMFTRVAPQIAQNSQGITVQVADREHVELVDGGFRAVVEVEFGPVTGVYVDTIRAFDAGGSPARISEQRKQALLQLFQEGLRALEVKYELVRG